MLHVQYCRYTCVFVYYVDGIVRLIVKRRLAAEGGGRRYPPTESDLRGRYAVFLGRKTINNTKRKQNRRVLWPSQTIPNDNCINRAQVLSISRRIISTAMCRAPRSAGGATNARYRTACHGDCRYRSAKAVYDGRVL